MSARGAKYASLTALAVLSGFMLIAWPQPWFVAELPGTRVVVTGELAAPAMAAFATAGLALTAALSLAGPFFRIVLGVLEMALAGCVLLSAMLALASPEDAASAAVTETTGVAGEQSVAALVQSVQATAWPWLAAASAILAILAGLTIAITGRKWPGQGARYQPVRFAAASADDTAAAWSALSDGDDPTSDRSPGQGHRAGDTETDR